eukprot:scpid79965/ scgid21960/ Protein FRA10AC1 homolog
MASKIDFSNDGYDSDLEEPEPKKTWRSDPLAKKESKKASLPNKKVFRDEVDAAARRIGRYNGFMAMDAYSRHKQFVNYYCLHYEGKEHFTRDASRDRNDYDVLAENHQFLWNDEDDDAAQNNWEKRLAKKYYDKLFKEYCIADLSRYKENKVAMRWRVEREVLDGKGQFACGDRRCPNTDTLTSWEVNFGYMEHGMKKNALVKLRLCEACAAKLNYHHEHKRAMKEKELEKSLKRKQEKERQEKKKRRREGSGEDSDEYSSHSDQDTSASGDGANDAADRTDALFASLSASGANAGTVNSAADQSSDVAHAAQASNDPSQVWKKPVQVEMEKTQEEEFDDYFQDMFL